MSNSQDNRTTLLTAIIPVNDVTNRINFLMRWLNDCRDEEIRVILVHDSDLEPERILLREFVSKLNTPNIEIIEVSFESPGRSRNAGIAHLDTPYVCFWDSDDYPHVAIVLEKVRTLKAETDVLIGQFDVKNEKNLYKTQAKSADRNLMGIYATNPGVWRMIFASRLFQHLEFPEYKIAEDQLFLSRLEMTNLNYTILEDSFYTYIYHENLRLTQSSSAYPDLLAVQRELIKMLSQQNPENSSLTFILLMRVILAGLKRMSFRMKIASIYNFLPLLHKTSNAVSIIHAMVIIRKYRSVKK